MNYSSSLNYLNSFRNFEQTALKSSSEMNLHRMRRLLAIFGSPEKSFLKILIAGTKGKGSTGFFLESILCAAGIPCGFYSSPHLETPRERIRIHGRMIDQREWVKILELIYKKIGGRTARLDLNPVLDATYFEIMTLMAVLAMKRRGVKVGIFEVGLGGRLDATNAMDHPISIMTPIGFDHEAVLGNTLTKIATEKAAIIQPRSYVVSAVQKTEAAKVLNQRTSLQKVRTYRICKPLQQEKLGLQGDYQKTNAALAVEASKILSDNFQFNIIEKHRVLGLQKKAWPGRLERFKKGRKRIVLDSAHNLVSVEALVRNLKMLYPNQKRLIVFGTSKDKPADKMLKILSREAEEIVLTQAGTPRAWSVQNLMELSRGLFNRIYPSGTVREALKLALRAADRENPVVVVCGSFFVTGEAWKALGKGK